jgi:hypothetical protein
MNPFRLSESWWTLIRMLLLLFFIFIFISSIFSLPPKGDFLITNRSIDIRRSSKKPIVPETSLEAHADTKTIYDPLFAQQLDSSCAARFGAQQPKVFAGWMAYQNGSKGGLQWRHGSFPNLAGLAMQNGRKGMMS